MNKIFDFAFYLAYARTKNEEKIDIVAKKRASRFLVTILIITTYPALQLIILKTVYWITRSNRINFVMLLAIMLLSLIASIYYNIIFVTRRYNGKQVEFLHKYFSDQLSKKTISMYFSLVFLCSLIIFYTLFFFLVKRKLL